MSEFPNEILFMIGCFIADFKTFGSSGVTCKEINSLLSDRKLIKKFISIESGCDGKCFEERLYLDGELRTETSTGITGDYLNKYFSRKSYFRDWVIVREITVPKDPKIFDGFRVEELNKPDKYFYRANPSSEYEEISRKQFYSGSL